MTKQEFDRHYQLLRQITQGDVCTHHALASTGAVVMVHLFAPSAKPQEESLLALVERLGNEDRQRVLSTGDVEGSTFIVTRFLLDFTSLPEWLESRAAPAPAPREPEPQPLPATSPPPAPSQPAAHEAAPPGEFTRLFGVVDPSAATSPPGQPVTAPAPAERAAVSPASTTPGEFTRIFAAPAPPAAAVTPAAPMRAGTVPEPTSPGPSQSATPPAPSGPGEFTSVFGAVPPPAEVRPDQPTASEPVPPVPPPQPPAPPAVDAGSSAPAASRPHPPPPPLPGEFTSVFGAATPPVPPRAAPPPPGDFTSVFGAAPPPAAPPSWGGPTAPPRPSPSPPTRADDYAARLSGAPRDLGGWPPATPDALPVTPPTPSDSGDWNLDLPRRPPPPPGPSEFTRVVAAPQPGQLGLPGAQYPAAAPAYPPAGAERTPPQTGAQPPAGKPPSRTLLVVSLVVVGLLTVLAIVGLILWNGRSPAPTP